MEELGIGRPSTYAATLATLRDREYITIDKRKLMPEPKGRLVISFLKASSNAMSNMISQRTLKKSST